MPERKPPKESLFAAIESGDLAEVQRLLDRGADVNARDQWNRTPLHVACWYGHPDTVRLLLEKGADVGARNQWNHTPLHWACIYGQSHIATLLLDRGADIEVKDKWGRTPLHVACNLPESNAAREPLLEIFRDRFPEAWFTKFCESPGRMPGR